MGFISSIIGLVIALVFFFPLVVNNFSSSFSQLMVLLAVLFFLAIVLNLMESLFKGGKK